MKRICINCGSSPGANTCYSTSAKLLGSYLGQNGFELIYGGARVGLMGDIADAALAAGGKVIGVITEALAQIVRHDLLSELIIVDTMHTRKMKMFELSDAFIALPGGMGTLDELFEILTWAQLGIHGKPVGILNSNRYYDKLLEFLDYAVDQRFVKQIHRDLLLVEEDPEALVQRLTLYRPAVSEKWIDMKIA